MRYMIFYTGVASTPSTVGLQNLTTGEKICEINCSRPTGKGTRKAYEKYKSILNNKFKSLL